MDQEDIDQEILNKLSRLTKDGRGNKFYLSEVSELTKNGVSEEVLTILLDLMIDTSKSAINTVDKLYILENCLIPQTALTVDVYFKVLSIIGTTQIYYQNVEVYKTKKLKPQLQLQIFDWLIDNYDYVKSSAIKSGSFLLSMLVKNLSYEYSRFHISKLILLLLNDNESIITDFKNKDIYYKTEILQSWHIQQTVNLYNKFPLDIYLRELLAFYKIIKPNLDYFSYSQTNARLLNNLRADLTLTYGWDENYQDNHVGKFQSKKVISSAWDKTNYANETTSLVQNILNQSNNLNPYSMFRSSLNDIKKTKFLILLIIKNEKFRNKIESYVEFNLQQLNMNDSKESEIFMAQLNNLYALSDGTIELSSVYNYVIDCNSQTNYFEGLSHRAELLQYLNIYKTKDLLKMIQEDIVSIRQSYVDSQKIDQHACKTYVEGILRRLSFRQDAETINKVLPELYHFVVYCVPCQDYLTNKIVLFIQKLDNAVISQLNDTCMILLKPLVYSSLLSGNLIYLNDICQHIAMGKNHVFSDDNIKLIQNSYIMDAVNILWRNKFLNCDHNNPKSPHKACYLNPHFLNQISSFHIFDNDEFLTFERLGEIFINPATSYLSTHLLRKLEDENIDTIDTRHEGPPTKESIERLLLDDNSNWLNLGVDELKLKILQEIDLLEFNGIGNLLFTSLKTLAGKRKN